MEVDHLKEVITVQLRYMAQTEQENKSKHAVYIYVQNNSMS